MNKRQFLKSSSLAVTGSFMSRIAPAELQIETPTPPRTNWSGNYTYTAAHLDSPGSVDELQQLIRSRSLTKALGSRHSFNNIADTSGDQISTRRLDTITLDRSARTVTVGPGVTYGKLAPIIDAAGFALPNLASLPHITVAGACATGTHGSGVRNRNLSTSVSAIELLDAKGNRIALSRQHDGDQFLGSVVALGALGIVTAVTLDLVPSTQMRQVVYQDLPLDQLRTNLDQILSSGYSVSLFTDWQNKTVSQVWIKSVVDPNVPFHIEPTFFGAKAATRKLHPITSHPAESCTDQLGIPGPWYERLPHFLLNFTPSSGQELQTEYFVPRSRGYEAILAVEQLRDHITPHLFISEIRTIAADDLWLSPAYQRDSMAIHFTWKPEWNAVRPILPQIEAALAPFDARPHWAKLFTIPADRLHALYPRMSAFQALLQQHDPTGRFHNQYLTTNVLSA